MHCRIDPDGKFTMHLSLENATTDSLKKHYIIHEFGHALGLGHEHQRAKFWRIVFPFVYTELMMNDPTIGGVHRFVNDWRWILESYYTSDLGDNSVEYDPDSIMHYWLVNLILILSIDVRGGGGGIEIHTRTWYILWQICI